VEISLVVSDIFRGICRFLPSHPKGYSSTLVISGVTGLILIKFAQDVSTILPLNIFESKLPYSYLFQNASLPNKDQITNFCPKFVTTATSLEDSEKRSRSIIYLVKKIVNISPVHPQITGLQEVPKNR